MKRLAEVFEFLHHLLSSKEDTAFDCAKGNVHLLGDFLVFVAVEVHHEGIEVGLFHALNVFENGGKLRRAIRLRRTIRRHGTQNELVLRVVNVCVLVTFFPVVVDEGVLENRIQPSFDVGSFLVPVLILDRFVEGFLNQVFRIFRMMGQFERQRS